MKNSEIFIADRRTPLNPSHAGNPLIEALFDQLTAEQFYKILAERGPLSRIEALKLPSEIRLQHLDDIRAKFLVPNRRLYTVYELIHTSINSSYLLRNPLSNSIKSNLQRDYRNFTQQFNENFESTFSKSSIIVGVSGIGKTTGINVSTALFPPALKHIDSETESFIQVPIVKIECPKDGSIKDLCRYFFIELDRILGRRKYELEYCKSRDNASDRVIAMSKLVAAHCIGVLIVDEIQHLSKAKSGGPELMLNFFLHLDNELHIPIIVVGTPEAIDLFSEKQRLRRRFTAGGALKWDRLPNDKEWALIIKQLFKYQFTEKEADQSVNWSQLFYFHSQGVIDRAIKIFIAAQMWAFKICANSITIDIVQKVVTEMMWLDEDVFRNIREGNLNRMETTDIFLPEIKTDLMENYRLVNIQNELRDFDIPENFSFSLIEEYLIENPSLADNDIAFKIIKEYKNITSSKNSKSNIARKKNKLKKNLIQDDLRRCVSDDKENLHEQLIKLGVIEKLEKFMI